jgi:peptide/nickel transport system substrate-binding protein
MSATRSSHRVPRGWIALVLVIGATSVVSACASTGAPNEAPSVSSGETLRVAMTASTWSALDPQGTWGFNQFELLRCCLVRTLMTYRGVPDSPGTEPVPDLATEPPSVSADGLTWTFRLRRGIHYGPPFENVEVTAADIRRALLRSSPGEINKNGPGLFYLPTIEGFSEYAAGATDTITGVAATDRYTLRVRTVRPDTSVTHLFAMAFTAPIPPLPGDPDARFGAATGHPLAFPVDDYRHPTGEGYGPFLVSTGPYMFEGAPDLDFSAPPEQQAPVAGFVPAWGFEDFSGHITLVRNPSWDPETDPNRPALPSRIEVDVAPMDADLFRKLEAGAVDVLVGQDPPNHVAVRYRSSASLQKHLMTSAGAWSYFAEINLAQPPFDDVHVRRALALALDRAALAESVQAEQGVVAGSPTTHVVPDPLEGSLLARWDRFGSANGPDLATAHAEMAASRYGRNGLCSGPACDGVIVGVASAHTGAILRAALTELGITPTIREKGDELDCEDPRSHVGLCVGGWGADFPDAGTWFAEWRSSSIHASNVTLLGASPAQLRAWGYEGRRVPSIDRDYERCSSELGMEASLCWARLDQFVVGELAAAIPIFATEAVRLTGSRVTAASFDQAFTEPALDRIAVGP